MNGPIADIQQLLEAGNNVRTLVRDQFRSGAFSKINHTIQANRYTFKCMWPEDVEKRHVCSNHDESQKLGYELLDDWDEIIKYADNDLVQ
jgi:hypothetical protein